MTTAANDTRPLQPLTFLAAAIRAECADLDSLLYAEPMTHLARTVVRERLARLTELCVEVERHAGVEQ